MGDASITMEMSWIALCCLRIIDHHGSAGQINMMEASIAWRWLKRLLMGRFRVGDRMKWATDRATLGCKQSLAARKLVDCRIR